jgi:hypothetical protein
MRFIPRQEVSKKIVDAQHPEVKAWRYECRKCGHALPQGGQPQANIEANGMAGVLLSYEIVLSSLGMGIGKNECVSGRPDSRTASAWIET